MSTSAPTGPPPNPCFSEHDQVDSDTFSGVLQPDPLLGVGSFIDANPPDGQTLTNEDNQRAEPEAGHQSNIAPDSSAASRGRNVAEPEGPTGSPADSKSRRRSMTPESWLPPGWTIEDRIRISGATAGTIDKYYIDPVSGRRFRSKNEVLYFVENGSPLPKRKKDTDTSESAPGNKSKKTGNKAKPTLNFDFINAPEQVKWVLTDDAAASWTPFIGDERLPESASQEWTAAFASITAKKGGQTSR